MTVSKGTIRGIAQETGLSVATISRVINGAKNVSQKTREIVLEACNRSNYIPNPAARALSTKRYRTIAAIVPTLEHSIFARFLTAIETELGQHGYNLVVASSHSDAGEELRAARKLLGLGVEGFILSGIDHHPGLLPMLDLHQAPGVFTSCFDETSHISTIGYDNTALAADALNLLQEYGHDTIAVLHGPTSNNDRTRMRIQGAKSAIRKGTSVAFVKTEISISGGSGGIAQLVKDRQVPSAILCFSDIIALGAYFELSSAGLTVPNDVSLMGFDNLDWAATATPSLTTIDLPVREMGKRASTALVNHLENSKPIEHQNLVGKIIVRESVVRKT